MAQIEKIIPHLTRWEGGFVQAKGDRGGVTNRGVTLATYRAYYGAGSSVEDLRKMTDAQWLHILRAGYWEPCRADKIENQSLANLIVDFAFNSGARNAIRRVQRALALRDDGIVGPVTLHALNSSPDTSFALIWSARFNYYRALASQPGQQRFLSGWLNRLNDLKFSSEN